MQEGLNFLFNCILQENEVLKFEVGLSLMPFLVKHKSLFVFRIFDGLETLSINQKLCYIAVMLESWTMFVVFRLYSWPWHRGRPAACEPECAQHLGDSQSSAAHSYGWFCHALDAVCYSPWTHQPHGKS